MDFTPEDDSYAARWAIIKRQVSNLCVKQFNELKELSESRQKRKESGVWQRRYWEHQIRDDLDFQRHMDYLHWNPVKHGYVRNAVDAHFLRFIAWCPRGSIHQIGAAIRLMKLRPSILVNDCYGAWDAPYMGSVLKKITKHIETIGVLY